MLSELHRQRYVSAFGFFLFLIYKDGFSIKYCATALGGTFPVLSLLMIRENRREKEPEGRGHSKLSSIG